MSKVFAQHTWNRLKLCYNPQHTNYELYHRKTYRLDFRPRRPAIEIGKEEAGGQNVYVRHVGEALAELGWEVDMFTRKVSPEQESIVQHSENCRTIRLKAAPGVCATR